MRNTKRILGSIMVVMLLFTLVVNVGARPVQAADTATIYSKFTEIIDASEFTFETGEYYAFPSKQYAYVDAVINLPSGSAIFTPTIYDNFSPVHESDPDHKDDIPNLAISQDTPNDSILVAIIQSGADFDDCCTGAITYHDDAWYYYCSRGAKKDIGPFYIYKYEAITFIASDVTVSLKPDYNINEPITNDDLIVSIVVNGVTYILTPEDVTIYSFDFPEISISIGGLSVTNTDVDVKYTITFNKNSGKGSMENQVISHFQQDVLSSNTFTKKHFIFSGWNTMANGSGIGYTDGESLILDGDLILYAQWLSRPEPNTGDSTPIIVIGLIGLLAIISVLIVKRKST